MFEIIVKQKGQKYRPVEFKDLKPIKDIVSVILLWNYNSYVAEIHKGILINGGRWVQADWLSKAENLTIEVYRRHNQEIKVSSKEIKSDRTSYLLGFQGIIKEEMKEVYLQITEDGQSWKFVYKR